MNQNTIRANVLRVLNDRQWHGCSELVQFGLSYRNRISELREEGYIIKSKKDGKRPTYAYQLCSVPEETQATSEWTPLKQVHKKKQTLLCL